MKKKQLAVSLAATTIMMSSMVGNVFADSSTTDTTSVNTTSKVGNNLTHLSVNISHEKFKSYDIMTFNSIGFNHNFIVIVNIIGNSELGKSTPYEIKAETIGNFIY